MSNAPRVKVDITKNIHSIIAIHPNIAWDDSVEVSIYSRSGPYSGYLSVMIEKNMVEPEMFRLAKYGLKTALVLQ